MIDQVLHAAVGLIAITNPIGNAPIFLSITEGRTLAQRAADAFRACLFGAILIIGAAAAGSYVLSVFGITMPALRIAGGLLIVIIGFNMVMGGTNTAHDASTTEGVEDRIFIPFTMPLVAGPGTLATAITLVAHAPTGTSKVTSIVIVAMGAGIALATLWLALMLLAPVEARLGERAVAIVTRLMGLILLAMGVQFVIDGVIGVWHADFQAG